MLKGKTAIVTGASRGIGREIAIRLASEGANIVLNYLNSEDEAKKVAEIIENLGSKVLIFKGDVSKHEDSKALVEKALEEFKSADILINNAGITRDNLILRMSDEEFSRVIDVNLKGAYNCIKDVVPYMMKKRWGRIINISSIIGLIGNVGQINYAAAKAGLIGMTKSASKELGGRNITVNAIAPGFIDTDMTRSLKDEIKDAMIKEIPLKRLGQPKDIANLAAFLSSDNAEYITGQVICVDGGLAL